MMDFRSTVSWSIAENKHEDRETLRCFDTSGMCFRQHRWQSTPSDTTFSFPPPSLCSAHPLSGEG